MGRLLTPMTSIRIYSQGTKTLAFFAEASMKKKKFYASKPGVDNKKPFFHYD